LKLEIGKIEVPNNGLDYEFVAFWLKSAFISGFSFLENKKGQKWW